MYELIYQDNTIGIYNTEEGAIKYIKDNEDAYKYIRKEKIKPDFQRIDFGGYRGFYYIKKHKK